MLFLLFIFWVRPTWADSSFFSLAQRTSHPHCWVKYPTSSHRSNQSYACISRSDWILWLNHPAPPHPLLWAQPTSSWKSFSPLILHPEQAAQKKIVTQQKLILSEPLSNPSPSRSSLESAHRFSLPQQIKFWIIHHIEHIREKGSQVLQPYDRLGILRSLIFHEGIHQEPLPMFRRLGFVHLVTTTGIHLYAFRNTLSRILIFLCHLFGIEVRKGLWIRRILSFTCCTFLWLLNGARLGMLRPWSIILLGDFASYLGLKWKRGVPLLLILLLEGVVQSVRFSLDGTPFSQGALFYGLAVGGGLAFVRAYSHSHLGLALGSWVLLALWEAWEEHLISFATPLLSLITLPFICGLIYPSVLILLTLQGLKLDTLAQFGFKIIDSILHQGLDLLTQLSLLPGNLWVTSHRALVFGVLFSSVLMIFLIPQNTLKKRIKLRVSALILLVALRFTNLNLRPHGGENPLPSNEATRILQLDVGQGDAALIFSPQKVGLIDGGSRNALKDLDWLRLLASQQIAKLNWVAVSHLDEDHVGGIYRLARLVPIQCIATPHAPLSSQKENQFQAHLKGLELFYFGEGCIPFPTQVASSKKIKPNSHMGVLFVPLVGGGSFLSTGDLNSEDEPPLGHWAANLSSERSGPKILKVSHHGSKTATSSEFLQLYTPSEAWISVGHRNRYHHPHPSILQRLSDLKIKIRRTDQEGPLSYPPPRKDSRY